MGKEALICSPAELISVNGKIDMTSFYQEAADVIGVKVRIKETVDGKALFVYIEDGFRAYLNELYKKAGGSDKFWALFSRSKAGGIRVPKT